MTISILPDDDDISAYYATLTSYAKHVPAHITPPSHYKYAQKRTKICGSQIEIALCVDKQVITDIMVGAQSCVIGKTAAFICQKWAKNKNVTQINDAHQALTQLLNNQIYDTKKYDFLTPFEPLIDLRNRHEVMKLPYMILQDILTNDQ